MKLFLSIAVLTLSAASLSAGAVSKASALFGEPVVAPSAERAIVTAVAGRTITLAGDTKWVNVNHYDVVQFASNGREFTWSFDGMAGPHSFDLSEIAPAGFVNHGVTVYVADNALPY